MLEISSIVVAVGIAVLASLFSPEGKTKKWVNFVLGLVAFTVLATPLLSLDAGAWLPTDYAETQKSPGEPMEMLLSLSEEELEKKVANTFDVPLTEIEIKIIDITQKKLEAKASERLDQTRLSRYLKNLMGEDWEVSIFGG